MSELLPVVSVFCATYNHEKFIADTIEGFLMQKTSFPIEFLIHDDASTDATATIVRKYQTEHPELIRAVFQSENQFSQGKSVFTELFRMARGKYIAECEGDDYWTDPLKLQKQVDYLEEHGECSICCHKVLYKYEKREKEDHVFPNLDGNKIYTKVDLYRKFFIKTCSAMYINKDTDKLQKFLEGFQVGDTPLWFFYAQYGDIGYLDEIMAVYRVHASSFTGRLSDQEKLLINLDTREMISKRLNIPGRYLNLLYILMVVIKNFNQEGKLGDMRKYLLKIYTYLPCADKEQLITILEYSLKAFLPFLYKSFYSTKKIDRTII
jgi:glycosyltransferase involved in cell wall biosynthesis